MHWYSGTSVISDLRANSPPKFAFPRIINLSNGPGHSGEGSVEYLPHISAVATVGPSQGDVAFCSKSGL